MPKPIPANRKQDGGIDSIMQSWCFPTAICGHHAVPLALCFLDITPIPGSFSDPWNWGAIFIDVYGWIGL